MRSIGINGEIAGYGIKNIIDSVNDIEHLDSCFADYSPVGNDIRSREYAANEIADCVDSRDRAGVIVFLAGLAVSLLGSIFGGISMHEFSTSNRIERLASNKPTKKYGH